MQNCCRNAEAFDLRRRWPGKMIRSPACRHAGAAKLVAEEEIVVGLAQIFDQAVRILRKSGFKAPIIMVTGRDTDSDTILRA
jgi:hypothetical protein